MAKATKSAASQNADPFAPEVPGAAVNFKRKAALVVPTLSIKNMKEGDTLDVKCVSEPHYEVSKNDKGEVQYNKDGTEKQLATIRVINLVTGELGQLVLPAIVERAFKEFREANGEIIGHCFELVRGRSLGTGKANLWEVYEIEAPEA